MVTVMVIYSALVRSHQSTSLVASASCVPRGYNTRAQPCLNMWRGSPDLPAQPARAAYPVHARPAPGGGRCCIIKPPLAVGLGCFCGGLGAQAHRPRCSHPGSCTIAVLPPPLAAFLSPSPPAALRSKLLPQHLREDVCGAQRPHERTAQAILHTDNLGNKKSTFTPSYIHLPNRDKFRSTCVSEGPRAGGCPPNVH